MPELPTFWGLTMASWALTYLMHSTVLIGLAWAVTRSAWFQAPRTREVIWTVALLGGLVTSLAATLDRTPRVDRKVDVELRMVRAEAPLPPPGAHMERLAWEGDVFAVPAVEAGLDGDCREALKAPGTGGEAWLEAVQDGCLPAGGWGGQPSGMGDWPVWLLAAWLLGAVGLGWGELRRHMALRRIRVGLAPADSRVGYALARVVDGLEMDAVRARVSQEVDTPCVVDSRTVVLPPRCQEELDDPELLAVLAHEVAHISRRDVRWQSLFRWFTVVFWFQPLNRLALRRLRDVVELICDDWAVGRIPRPVDLARSLSRVAEWSMPASRSQPALAGSQGGHLCERVRRILGSRAGHRSEGPLRGALVAAALVAVLTQLPSVGLPEASGGIFVLKDEVRLHEGAWSFEGQPVEAGSAGGMRQLRVRIQDLEG